MTKRSEGQSAAPESSEYSQLKQCGCREEWAVLGQVTRFSKIETTYCLYPATVERLKEADKQIDEMLGHLQRYQRLRIAEEALTVIEMVHREGNAGGLAREALERIGATDSGAGKWPKVPEAGHCYGCDEVTGHPHPLLDQPGAGEKR